MFRVVLAFIASSVLALPAFAAKPPAPSGLAARAASSTQIDLAWTDTSTIESGFYVERAFNSGGPWSRVATVPRNTTAYSNTGLGPGTRYYYRVLAYEKSVSAPSNVSSDVTPQTTPACVYTISPTSASFPAGGDYGLISVSTTAGCAWTATSNAPWISFTSGASGSGGGSVYYSVAPNSTATPRTGAITVGGQTFTISQAGDCIYALGSAGASYTASGGSSSFSVTAGTGCNWTASSGAAWITVTAGATGSGNGTVSYSVAANTTTSTRTGTITAAGQSFTVTQAAASAPCTYALSATSASVPATATSGSLNVTAASGCTWTASSSATWVTITAGASGSGNGTVNYSVAANTATSSRTGTMTVAGQTFTVSQAGATSSAPANDAFAAAPAIAATTQPTTGSNVGATKESGEPNITTNPGGASVWWYWTAPAPGTVTVNTAGSSFDTLLGVYTGSAISALTLVAGNDDVSGLRTSQVSFNAVAGTRYQIVVDGYSAAKGTISLSLSQAAPCTYAISATSASVPATANNGSVNVTSGAGCSWTASSSASWITITAGSSGSGNGTVNYSVAANTATSSRSGTMTVAGQTFTVTQAAAVAPCTYALSATSASVPATASSGSVSVTSGTGCSWTASSSATWITITAGASGTGNGTVNYSAAANTATSSRTGTMTIAGQTFTVTQAAAVAPCTYALSATSASVPATASSGSVTVTSGTGCNWTASSSATWITITAGASGSGNGTVSYSVAANTATSSRSGTMTIAGQTFTVTQAAATCTYALSATSASVPATANSGSVTVTSGTGCSWTASSGATWITITAGASGTGNGTVSYSVAANTATTSRTGTMTVAGQAFTVTQAAAVAPCTYALSATSASVPATASSGSVTVTSGTGCSWTAVSGATWITITAGASGTGNGTVNYSVAANTATSSRTGTMTIAAQSFTVTQAASGSVADTTPPLVSLDSINNGDVITGDLILLASAHDNVAVTQVKFCRDSGIVLGTSTGPDFRLTVNSLLISNGSHTFYAIAYDAAGNRAYSSSVSAEVRNAAGIAKWLRGAANCTMPAGVVADKVNNIVTAGAFTGWIDLGGGATMSKGGGDFYIAKYDPNNTLLWAKTFGAETGDERVNGLAVDSQNNIIVTGYFMRTVDFGGVTLSAYDPYNQGQPDAFVAKYSPSGSLLWVVQGRTVGAGKAVAVDTNDNIVIAANLATSANFAGAVVNDGSTVLLLNLTSSGSPIWSKGFKSQTANDSASSVTFVGSDVVLAGRVSGTVNFGGGSTASGGGFVARYSGTSGAYKWAGILSADAVTGVAGDASGKLLVTNPSFTTAFDSIGNSLWSISNGGNAIVSDSTGNFVITGKGLLAASYTSAGVLRWSRVGSIESAGTGVSLDTLGNLLVAGTFTGTQDFGGVSGTAQTITDGFIVQYHK